MVDSVLAEFRDLKNSPLPQEELRRAKDQLKGNLMLGLESSTARMSNLARQAMYFDKFFTLDEISAQIEAVTAEEVSRMADELFQTERIAITILGNVNGLKISRTKMEC